MIIVKQEVVKGREERIGLKRGEDDIKAKREREKKKKTCSRSHLCQSIREIKRFSGDGRTTLYNNKTHRWEIIMTKVADA